MLVKKKKILLCNHFNGRPYILYKEPVWQGCIDFGLRQGKNKSGFWDTWNYLLSEILIHCCIKGKTGLEDRGYFCHKPLQIMHVGGPE